jgi:uncharacterized protein YyaL (SSP411 family)
MESEYKHTNALIHESSPYLLQHAHNPVNWHSWGEVALELAKKENKLILVSIGYSACHWCHVMERESFEDEEVAKVMNENFICIKVDREERPDIDQLYMNAVQLLTGSGGWPLNCFALPDGNPVYGGTYFRRDDWKNLLLILSGLYKNDRSRLHEQAERIRQGIHDAGIIPEKKEIIPFNEDTLNRMYHSWELMFDYQRGGTARSPKFPMPNNYQFLLRYYYHTRDKKLLKYLFTTLDNMARGGIYDALGGGFARYSSNRDWFLPHFEKMLYDNAQLISLYSEAYQLTKSEEYKSVVYETIGFAGRELMSGTGGFYSALDADSEGIEGKYYTWDYHEIIDLLSDKPEILLNHYNVSETGNWEKGRNILFRRENIDSPSKEKLQQQKDILFRARQKRIRPGLDDKILMSWNALMLNGLTDAYKAFNEPGFLELALDNSSFIMKEMIHDDYRLEHLFSEKKHRKINGFLDDYSFTIAAFINLYQVTLDEEWLNVARGLADYSLEHFHDVPSQMFFYTSDLDPKVITRKMEIPDNVIPSSNSMMAINLHKLSVYFDHPPYQEISKQMMANIAEKLVPSGTYFSNWGILLLYHVYPSFEVVIAGSEAMEAIRSLGDHFLPHVIFAGSTQNKTGLPLLENRFVGGETNIYVCRERVCKMPVQSVEEALELIEH